MELILNIEKHFFFPFHKDVCMAFMELECLVHAIGVFLPLR